MPELKYGLTNQILSDIDLKLSKQKDFLEKFVFDFGDGDKFNLLDKTMSANINPKKYFAEVNNRVNSLFEYAKALNLYPVFLTITLPDRFHPSSKKYDSSLTVRDGVEYLSNSWARFRALKIFKNIRDVSGHNMIYIRVIEPHKSGVPHCHVMLFAPKNFIVNRNKKKSLKFIFKRHFSSNGASNYAQNFKYTWSNDSGGAVAYILKYLNKTFKHALEDKMTLEAYYYAHYSIIRFTCSKTLVPLYIHRKIKHDERFRNFLQLTHYYRLGLIYHLFDKKFIFYRCLDEEEDEIILFSKNAMIDDLFKKPSLHVPMRLKEKKSSSLAPVFYDGVKSDLVFSNNRFYVPIKRFDKYSDYNLLSYYNSLDVDSCDINHFVYIRNLCVSRGLFDSDSFLTNQIYGFEDYKRLISF
jgi:hypothetical protein